VDVELVTIETRGDRDRATPLSRVGDAAFFSAEIDAALREGRIDFAVHSLKDLPLEPRPGIRTAAIPAREDPRDVVVFRPEVLDLLRSGERLRIGSSSERRAHLTQSFLREALPRFHDADARLEFPPLRGAVEERVARLRLPPGDERALDGVVLALAGLARLWGDRDGHASLAPLLTGTRLMVLPLSACPTAPGQGALAVECRSDDAIMSARLAAIDDPATARRARRELDLLLAQPAHERGGFAATSLRHERCGTLVFVGGQRGDLEFNRLIWKEPPRPQGARAWDGADWVRASGYRATPRPDLGTPPAIFLAHWRALAPGLALPEATRTWVSGVESWRRLARRGTWVEGCADNLGFAAIVRTLATPVLRLPALGAWTVLTREDAVESWRDSDVGRTLATYAIDAPEDEAALNEIRSRVATATHFFWGSAAQYRALRAWLPAGSHHACGPGKTWQALAADGLANLRAFPSRQEWRSWVA
jgi:hydroxymethylbilane synthase